MQGRKDQPKHRVTRKDRRQADTGGDEAISSASSYVDPATLTSNLPAADPTSAAQASSGGPATSSLAGQAAQPSASNSEAYEAPSSSTQYQSFAAYTASAAASSTSYNYNDGGQQQQSSWTPATSSQAQVSSSAYSSQNDYQWSSSSSAAQAWSSSYSASQQTTSVAAVQSSTLGGGIPSQTPNSTASPTTIGLDTFEATSPSGSAARTTDSSGAVFNSADSSSTSSSGLGIGGIAGTVVGILALVVLIASVLLWRKKRKEEKADRDMEEISAGLGDMMSPTLNFVGFRDDASTHSHHGSPRPDVGGYSVQAPYTDAGMLQPRLELPDDDDASHYSAEDQDNGRHSYRYSSTRYNQPMPEYLLPSPPVPAFDRNDALQSREQLVLSPHDPNKDLNRSRSVRSTGSRASYVDEQLRDLYVGHY